MKHHLIALIAVTSLAFPAAALEVTNLDTHEHRVALDVAGSQEIRTVAAGATEFFVGKPNGFISLLSAKTPKKGKATLQSDGILSGYIGNGRTSGLPAENRDVFVIWPDGSFTLQQRRRGGRFN